MKTKRSALGRGLSAILESPETDITSSDISGNFVTGAIANITLDNIEANPFQPRNSIEEKALIELADSIREQGIIQPVTVRKMGYDKFQLISGERRYRAARMAGLNSIPAYIRIADDQQMLELALIENIHREDLNSLDIAISYQRLLEECKMTTEQLSSRIGMDRTTITNYIRLLKLPPELQIALKNDKISMGHARALINIDDVQTQLHILDAIISKNLSVRDVERIVKELNGKKISYLKKKPSLLSEKFSNARKNLSACFDTRVHIKADNKGKGSIVIHFNSEQELDKILSMIQH